ncbi:MAG: hypothetical protein ACUVWR_04265 [Anaerolineae bacterium]
MSFAVSLTVAQSKRLIAKGVVASPIFREASEKGKVLIIKGTTNAYVVEEVTGKPLDKLSFARGLTLPHGLPRREASGALLGDVLIDKGQVNLNADIAAAVDSLGRGDLILKGANALNYNRGLAGVLIGDPRAGTIGMALRRAVGSHVGLMIPVGLEKCIAGDIMEVAGFLQSPGHRSEAMMPVWGHIFTEIEALQVLCGVQATHIASGGVSGAEGAVWLALDGDETQLEQARVVLESVYSEGNLV